MLSSTFVVKFSEPSEEDVRVYVDNVVSAAVHQYKKEKSGKGLKRPPNKRPRKGEGDPVIADDRKFLQSLCCCHQ